MKTVMCATHPEQRRGTRPPFRCGDRYFQQLPSDGPMLKHPEPYPGSLPRTRRI